MTTIAVHLAQTFAAGGYRTLLLDLDPYVILNAVSPNFSVTEEAARTITGEFGFPVDDVRLGSRVAYSRCMIGGQTVPEYEPEGKAAREVAKLYKWVCRLVDMSTRKGRA
jgi:chromosome partitioning protein